MDIRPDRPIVFVDLELLPCLPHLARYILKESCFLVRWFPVAATYTLPSLDASD